MAACFLPEEAVPFRLVHSGLSRGWIHLSQSSTGRVIEHPHKGPFVVEVGKLGEWASHLMGTSRQRAQATLRLLTATNLCFAERNVYTSEVLAVVMQQLMEQSPLPMLLMRTVIQSLTMYPRLGGFVMNILARLIMKQVTCPGPRRSATVCLEGRIHLWSACPAYSVPSPPLPAGCSHERCVSLSLLHS